MIRHLLYSVLSANKLGRQTKEVSTMETIIQGRLYSKVLASSALLVSSMFSHNAVANTFYDALANGKTNLDAQLRLETVEQDNALDDSSLLSFRTRLGYETAKLSGFAAKLEFENITAVGSDDNFFSPGPNSPLPAGLHSVIADPEVSEVNKAFVSYSGFSDTLLKYGRQTVNLGNSRFIGNVIWRQNEQTYDGFSIKNTSFDDLSLFLSHTTNANTVVGGNTDVDITSLHTEYTGFSAGKLTGYAYLYDFEVTDVNDSNTFGLQFTGGSPIGGGNKLLYTVEFARQSDAGDSTLSYDANYTLLEGAVKFKSGLKLLAGLETLGSDDGQASVFTPFSTLHKFNGWADVFLVGSTSAAGLQNGLEDFYFKASGKVGRVFLLAAYHDFSSDEADIDYGSEINLLAKLSYKKINYGFKYADYSADDAVDASTALGVANVDTERFWLWASTKF